MYGYYGYGDSWYYVLAIVLMIVSLIISNMVKSRYNKYSKCLTNMTGAQAAERILNANGIYDVPVLMTSGTLSDNYNPMNKTLNLSEAVYKGHNISAVCVAAHECGHAIQHANGYIPLMLRKTIVPVANICSSLSYVIIILGIFMQYYGLISIGVILFTVVVAVNVITLPVEVNASRRALQQIRELGIIPDEQDISKGRKVLTAAALTYFVAMLSALLQLLRLLSIANRNRD